MEILSPAGSYDALLAAVYGGADAVYFGAGNFNARQNAQNFTHEQIKEGIMFCRERGVATHAVLNTLVSQKEIDNALREAEFFALAGVNAFIVQDVGLSAALKNCTNVPLHASTQMSCHSLDGVLAAESLGFSRVVLARELEKNDIASIIRGASIEIEVFAHGALCMCYSGQCYMSSVIGSRSGNRGLCAQPCRLPYAGGYRLSLKDLCLLQYVNELEQIGVKSLKIEGRMKSPEYVYAVTRAYADAKKGKPYTPAAEEELAKIFSRDGFTKGYYLGKPGNDMFGTRPENAAPKKIVIEKTEYKRIALDVSATVEKDCKVRLFAETEDGFAAESEFEGQPPKQLASGSENVKNAFLRLGKTPYYLKNLTFSGGEVFMPQSLLNAARREVMEKIAAMRRVHSNSFTKKEFLLNVQKPQGTVLEAQFSSIDQLPDNADVFSKIWLPLPVVAGRKCAPLIEKYKGKIGAVMPRVFEPHEQPGIEKLLESLGKAGVFSVLCGNIGQAYMLNRAGFELHGDFGLNVFNQLSRDEYFNMNIKTLTLSFELNLAQIEDISTMQTGIIAYGRLPFMIMRNCVKHSCHENEFLTDRMQKSFLLMCDYGCRNLLYNADKLWLADKKLPPLGFMRLLFTDETKSEVKAVTDAYMGDGQTVREGITRGLYYKKV